MMIQMRKIDDSIDIAEASQIMENMAILSKEVVDNIRVTWKMK